MKLALNNEDGELIVKGGFYGASFSTIDTLNENDDNIEEDDLNWYILVIYIFHLWWFSFMTYNGFLSECGTIWMVFLT